MCAPLLSWLDPFRPTSGCIAFVAAAVPLTALSLTLPRSGPTKSSPPVAAPAQLLAARDRDHRGQTEQQRPWHPWTEALLESGNYGDPPSAR